MKRIALFLAAAAATLASCVKENTLAPEQTSDNLVTIKALATKTLLNGNAVEWELEDQIAVVLGGVENAVNFEIDGEVNGASAKFVGTIAPETEYTSAYAVYPATAYSVVGGEGKVSHTLPEVQTGDVSGLILSSAVLDADKLKSGNVTAHFKNALTLLQVVVPAGVKEVSLTASNDGLVGTTAFNLNETTGLLERASTNTPRTVKLAAEEGLEAKTYPVLVYPGNAGNLTLTMVGTDGAEYTNTIGVTFTAGEFRTIDLTKIFKVATGDLHVVLPTGGTVEVPVVTADAYEYQVSLSEGAEAWVSYVLPTKGFHKETITFTVDENTTDADREADVTISWGEGKTKTFKIQQKNVYMDFVNDENGDPIQWEETFSVYATKEHALAGTNPTTYKNVFTIALSDDFTKGAYKISGMFGFNDIYSSHVTPTYYANYVGGELTVIQNQDGFYFQSDITFAYDAEAKTFTMTDPVAVGSRFDISGWQNKSGWIYGYNAAVKVEEPATEPSGVEALYGEYTETFGGTYPTPGKTIIEASDRSGYDVKVTFFKPLSGYGSGDVAYGKVNPEGTEISFEAYTSNMMGPLSAFTLTVDGNNLSGSYGGTFNYTATKVVPFDVAMLYGEYTETFGGTYPTPGKTIIEASDRSGYDVKVTFFKPLSGYGSGDVAYGKVNPEGTEISFEAYTSNMMGPLSAFTLTVDGNNLSGSYGGTFKYTATKQ